MNFSSFILFIKSYQLWFNSEPGRLWGTIDEGDIWGSWWLFVRWVRLGDKLGIDPELRGRWLGGILYKLLWFNDDKLPGELEIPERSIIGLMEVGCKIFLSFDGRRGGKGIVGTHDGKGIGDIPEGIGGIPLLCNATVCWFGCPIW